MAAFFFDLDGTILEWGTDKFIEGAVEKLKQIKKEGHQLFFTTYRGPHYPITHLMHPKNVERVLKIENIEYDGIVYGVVSPRIIVNDDGCHAINHQKDEKLQFEIEEVIGKCYTESKNEKR